MPDIARRSPADLKPLPSGLSAEVLDWAAELRMIWGGTGLSMNQFASLHPIDKGTISRYLNGQRVPRDRWFLDKLLAIQADYGQPVTPAVREHLARLQLRALAVAHPHEYRVRRVNDKLEIATAGKLEAELYARGLEEQLADRNRQVSELAEAKGRMRAAWDADRVVMKADCERLTREIGEIAGQLDLARKRTIEAERRCRFLEDLLDQLDAHTPAEDEDNTGAPSPGADRQFTVARSASERVQRSDSAAVLIGRDSDTALLTGLTKEAARGRDGPVLIEGKPGIGRGPRAKRRKASGWYSLTPTDLDPAAELARVHESITERGYALTTEWDIGLPMKCGKNLRETHFNEFDLWSDRPADRERARDVVLYKWDHGRLTLEEYETIAIWDPSGIGGEHIHKRIELLWDPQARELIETLLSLVPKKRRQREGTFGINLFRTHTDVVTRPHQGMEEYIILYVVGRVGDRAESYLYERDEQWDGKTGMPVLLRQLDPGELMIFKGSQFMHGAMPLMLLPGEEARRDVLVCTVDYPTTYLERAQRKSHAVTRRTYGARHRTVVSG